MKIAMIGAGNVGYHLGRILHEKGEEVIQVFSRTRQKARRLADLVSCEWITEPGAVTVEADLYILAVHDDAIGPVAGALVERGISEQLIVHTSGATPISVFKALRLKRYGVFYPLQTFSISKEPDFDKIPFILDANHPDELERLKGLAAKITSNVHVLTDEQRAILHVAAVFANNFTNHLYHIAHNILDHSDITFQLLIPLIEETVQKLHEGSPEEMQTGPARRGDTETINRHLKLLEENPEFQRIYRVLTESIGDGRR